MLMLCLWGKNMVDADGVESINYVPRELDVTHRDQQPARESDNKQATPSPPRTSPCWPSTAQQ